MPSPGPGQVPSTSVSETPRSSQSQGAAEVSVSPGQPRLTPSGGAATLQVPEVASPQKKYDKRPSLVLGAPSHIAEQQPLSPASTIGAYSNNTPTATAVSPDTSPGEETAKPADKIAQPLKPAEQPSPKTVTPLQPPPNLVPSTPDEQLKLEEAQSLQQRTLAASKAIEETTGAAGPPSSSEVIKESILPPPTLETPVPERPEVSKEAGLYPLSLEEKKADQAKETSMEATTPGQGPSERMQTQAAVEEKPAAAAAPTPAPLKKPQPTLVQPTPPQPERMTTRVSSGAIRHKSVSEILGETPKQPVSQPSADRTPEDSTRATPVAASLSMLSDKEHADSPARLRFKDRKEREKERSKLSTVVFPKQQPEKTDATDLVRQNAGDLVAGLNEEKDYLFMLFQNKAYSPPRSSTLGTLLSQAHKTLTTANYFVDYQEQMDCRTLRRIYHLQNANRWPLRQMKRSVEPPRQATHWDVLLDHMKWMRTDFREERKWKIAAAKSCADWCTEYVNSDPEHRALLRVNARIPPLKTGPDGRTNGIPSSQEEEPLDEMVPVSHPTPELVHASEDESASEGFNDEPRPDLRDSVAPAAIFSLGSDEFTFSMDMTPAAEKLLDELPLYTPVKIAPDTKKPMFKAEPDSAWKTDILPVSKYAVGKITFRDDKPPPRKRSRYDYSQYEHEPDHEVVDMPPEQTNVALFRPENKHIRDRIHPGHSFRPPTEHPMPSLGFFESRQSSQWTYAEDDELRRLVKEYSYNWSLISSCLSPPSQFTSGAERRTPWECFERWIGLEGLPADMSKTQYFRAYHQRLEAAQRTVLAQQQAVQQQQQQQQGNNGQAQPPIRRRTTQPVRVDRRRNSKHLALLDAMRKLAKKRETMLQKQQHGKNRRVDLICHIFSY